MLCPQKENMNKIKEKRDALVAKVKKNKQLRLKYQDEIDRLGKILSPVYILKKKKN